MLWDLFSHLENVGEIINEIFNDQRNLEESYVFIKQSLSIWMVKQYKKFPAISPCSVLPGIKDSSYLINNLNFWNHQ